MENNIPVEVLAIILDELRASRVLHDFHVDVINDTLMEHCVPFRVYSDEDGLTVAPY